jgi:hypothetical protein
MNADNLTPERKAELARSILALEAFGLRFLEDSFAAGHVAGSWGDSAERLGSHGYYNAHGLETMTWDGKNVILLGDGQMRPEDLECGAAVAKISLAQVLEAMLPTARALREAVAEISLAEAEAAAAVDLCTVAAPPDISTPTLAYVPLSKS